MKSPDLRVELDPPYPVRLRATFREVWAALREDHGDRPWMIVADRRLLEKNPAATRGLTAAQRRRVVALVGGERVKSLRNFERLHRAAIEFGLGRDSLVIALGGGTIGDLTGFFASTWMRGVDWCPIATTSLALADSSIGGKTAVDVAGLKNLVGSFHQPAGVYGAIEAMESLPSRHRRAGLAEVVKSGIIADASLFGRIEAAADRLTDPRDSSWSDLLLGACRVKATVVAEDPRESGRRALLNFGHTFGHAFEATQRPRLLHGEAVSLGTIAACWISEETGNAPKGTVARARTLLSRLGLPVQARGTDAASFWRAMSYDKKARSGTPRLVLTEGIGSATFGHSVPRKILQAAYAILTT